MHLQVKIQSEAGQQRTELCPATAPISIGRHPQCVVRLDSDLVSRQHAVVHPTPSGMIVEDVSTNGTIAGERLLRRAHKCDVPIAPQSRLQVIHS